MRLRLLARAIALSAIVGLVAAACGGGGGAKATGPPVGAKKGGAAVFGAEQWSQCLNIITSCTTSSWMQIIGPQPTLPKLQILDAKGNYARSPLITELPSLENGGVTQNPFSVTTSWNRRPCGTTGPR